MVGFNPEGEIINYTVLEHQETPGLGDKISNWFKTEKGNQDIRGRKGGELLVKQDGGDVDAITAATEDEVQAVTGASQLKNQPAEPAVEAVTEATTGATQINETEVSHE